MVTPSIPLVRTKNTLASSALATPPDNRASSPTPSKQLLTKEEVCQEFGISLNTLTEWMKDGTVPFLRYGRRVYFEWASLLAAGRTHAQSAQDK